MHHGQNKEGRSKTRKLNKRAKILRKWGMYKFCGNWRILYFVEIGGNNMQYASLA